MQRLKVADIRTSAFLLRSALANEHIVTIVVAFNTLRSELQMQLQEMDKTSQNCNILSLEDVADVATVKGILNGSIMATGPLVFDNSAVLMHCSLADLRGDTKKQPRPVRLTLNFEDSDRESVVFDLDHVTYSQHRVVQMEGDMEDAKLQTSRDTRLSIYGASKIP